VLPTQELPTLELLALGLLTRGLTLGLVLQELRVEMLALLLLLGESVLAVLLVDRTDAPLSDHLLLTLGLTLGLVLRKLQVETRALLLILNNSVLTVLLVDRTETPLSDHLRHGTLQSAATPWESSEQSEDAKGVLASSNCSHSKSKFGDQNAHAGTANSAGAMTTEERSSMSSTLLSHLSCKVMGSIGTKDNKLGGISREHCFSGKGRNVEHNMRTSGASSCMFGSRHLDNAEATASSRLGSVKEKSDIE